MKNLLMLMIQLAIFIVIAPFLSGLIAKMKNNFRMRKGQSVLQPYYNLVKLFSKEEVISQTASWIFRVSPFVVFASSAAAAALVPVLIFSSPAYYVGDLLALIFLFSLGRFFLALSALDTGSSFGGMGSSREMFISSLAEPALLLVIFSVSLQFRTTNAQMLSGIHAVTASSVASALALFLVTLAETSRIPVDNQETHLELTMIHEAMVLEYSGPSLALLEMASYIKQMILFFLIAQIIFPIAMPVFSGPAQVAYWISWYLARLAIVAIAVAVVEVSVAKMRLFRAVDFLWFGFVIGVIAVICAVMGV